MCKIIRRRIAVFIKLNRYIYTSPLFAPERAVPRPEIKGHSYPQDSGKGL